MKTMKAIFAMCVIATLSSCGSQTTTNQNQIDSTIVDSNIVDTTVVMDSVSTPIVDSSNLQGK